MGCTRPIRFSPIGNSGTNFQGNYNGQNHTVSNLYINRGGQDYIGVFGYVNTSFNISNLGLIDVDIKGKNNVGGFVGNQDGGTISNSYSTSIVGGKYYVGGLVGYQYGGTISNSYSTGAVTSYANDIGGLVGSQYGGTISNSYSTGAVSGNANDVGGLVGYQDGGTISDSYSMGAVSGNATGAGGLVGDQHGGTISNSYSTSIVGGKYYVGGLVGYQYGGTISNSYSTGAVSGRGYFGGFIGSHNSGNINNCFWDTETSGQNTSAGGTGKTTAEMKTQSTFTSAGWDFTTKWDIQDGISYYSYPYFRSVTYDAPGLDPEINPLPGLSDGKYSGGIGTSGNPYLIATITDLIYLSNHSSDWNKYFIQTANIVFNSDSIQVDWDGNGSIDINDTLGFSPIGNNTTYFTGQYNGKNHTISNLFINRPNDDGIGLFGMVSSAKVRNLGILRVNIYGKDYVGGLIGLDQTYDNIIHNCYTAGSVSGNDYIGGLIGTNNLSSTINNCYSTCSVSGNNDVGGLIGLNFGNVSYCYSTGAISNVGSFLGGLIGENIGDVVTNCFWDTKTSGKSTSAGGTGKTTVQMKTQSTFTSWDFTSTWKIQNGSQNYSYPYLRDINYDVPKANPEVNPIPGLHNPCWDTVYVDESYDNNTEDWGFTHFSDLSLAVNEVCNGGTFYLAPESNFTYTGNLDFSNFKVELGDYDFELTIRTG